MPGNRSVCGACSGELARHLAAVPWLAAHLELTITRQTRIGSGGGSGARERPVPYDDRASRAAELLRDTMLLWAGVLAQGRRRPPGPACAARRCRHRSCESIRYWTEPPSTGMSARWLSVQLDRIERHPGVVEIVEGVRYAVQRAETVVDRPPDSWYAGPCDSCAADMYAEVGATMVQCLGCANSYGAVHRREQLLAAAEDALAPATLAARALTTLGQPVTPERIRKWAERNRITPHGTDPNGAPQYRIGDIRYLLAEMERRTAEWTAAKGDRMSA